MLGLILAITISTTSLAQDIDEVSSKLDVMLEQGVCGNLEAFKDLQYLEEILKYNKQKLDTSTTKNVRIDTAMSMYLLAIKELKEYDRTKDFQHFKHSLIAKTQADDLYRNTPH